MLPILTNLTKQFIEDHLHEELSLLALQTKKYPDVDVPMAIRQIAGRRSAVQKIPSWSLAEDLLFPRHLSLEQCSSEATARYKASLVQGKTLVDLTGGMGVDCAFMAASFEQATYVEQQAELCEIARHNFPLLGLPHIAVLHADSTVHLQQMERVDCIFIDPARRDGQGGKTVAIQDCEPDVALLSELLLSKAGKVIIKLAPMLDLSLATQALPFTQQIHIISVANECKELLLVLDSTEHARCFDRQIHCVNINRDSEADVFTFTREEELNCVCSYASTVEQYLYEPNASVLKAGAYKLLAAKFGIKKLHPNSHLYTSEKLIHPFPGRVFCCNSVFSCNKKGMKELLGDTKSANITVRNFPATVAELRKRTKLSDGGEIYLFATTLYDDKKVLIHCRKA